MAALQRRAPAMTEGGSSDVISVNAPAGSAESVWLTELAQLGISVGEVRRCDSQSVGFTSVHCDVAQTLRVFAHFL
jgi:hypothetical protein